MFSFLKGKQKGKVNCNVETNNKKYVKEKKRKNNDKRIDKKDKNNEIIDAVRTNSAIQGNKNLPSDNFKSDSDAISIHQESKSATGSLTESCISLDQFSASELNSTIETADLNSKSSGCRDNSALSNSSSRASIPSITTEFVDDQPVKELARTNLNSSLRAIPNHSIEMKPPINVNLISERVALRKSQVHTPPFNEDEDTSVSSSVYSSPPSPGPYSYSINNIATGIIDHASMPLSPNDRPSLISSLSGSSSSLSSLSFRPNSPSGRKTPPGPWMGTIAKLGTSPTPIRKSIRTNIKTNPNTMLSNINKIVSNSSNFRNVENEMNEKSDQLNLGNSIHLKNNFRASIHPPSSCKNNQIQDGINVYNEKENFNNERSYVPVQSIPNCVQYQLQEPRHSISSMHSLEPIQENECDIKVADKNELVNVPRDTVLHFETGSVPESSISTSSIDSKGKGNKLSSNFKKPTNELLTNDCSSDPFLDNFKLKSTKILSINALEKYINDFKNDDDSDSLKEPEIKEHKLELIPNSVNMKQSITFTTVKNSTNEDDRSSVLKGNTNNESGTTNGHCDDHCLVSDPESSCSISPNNIEPTHAVFQIPLRSKSCSRERTLSPQRSSQENEHAEPTIITYDNNLNCSDPEQMERNNIEGDTEIDSTVHCVEGHVELNFERGRSDQRKSKPLRNRSTSSARRQQLYEDIKKYTAQTKELKGMGKSNCSIRRPTSLSRESRRDDPDQLDIRPDRMNTISNVSRVLWGAGGKRSSSSDRKLIRQKSSSSQITNCNTLPKMAPKKLERSITVSEIKVNINTNGSSKSHSLNQTAKEISDNVENELVETKWDSKREYKRLISDSTAETNAQITQDIYCPSNSFKMHEEATIPVNTSAEIISPITDHERLSTWNHTTTNNTASNVDLKVEYEILKSPLIRSKIYSHEKQHQGVDSHNFLPELNADDFVHFTQQEKKFRYEKCEKQMVPWETHQ